jgi:hypothetical protein
MDTCRFEQWISMCVVFLRQLNNIVVGHTLSLAKDAA